VAEEVVVQVVDQLPEVVSVVVAVVVWAFLGRALVEQQEHLLLLEVMLMEILVILEVAALEQPMVVARAEVVFPELEQFELFGVLADRSLLLIQETYKEL
jgi:hypothetical protein